MEKAQDSLRTAVEGRLDAIRQESATKLDEMRQTVDEKLQTTLETRLGESFNRVVEQLERVHKGIGEMQTLAANGPPSTSSRENVFRQSPTPSQYRNAAAARPSASGQGRDVSLA
jgi:hypothetical protein